MYTWLPHTHIIEHCWKSLLFYENKPWKKKKNRKLLRRDNGQLRRSRNLWIGWNLYTYSPSKKSNCGLYRDDGLVILHNVNGQQIDRTRKNIIKIFKDVGFSIDIENDTKVVEFLDITFNLNNGIYKRYKKANNTLLYVNKCSTHRSQIINQILRTIDERLSRN